MLTSARERLEVLKLKRAGKLPSVNSVNGGFSASLGTIGSSTPRKGGGGGASIIQRESQPHTTIVMDPQQKQVDYWKNIAIERDKALEEREAREKEANRKFREDQKRILDEHVQLASARRVNLPEVNKKERDAVDKTYTDFVNEKKRKKEEDAQHQKEIGEMREAQIRVKKQRSEAEERERQEFERQAVERAKKALEEEKFLIQLQKEEGQKRREEMIADNERLKKLKQERKAVIAEEDSKALARMTEVLEHQAAVSKAEFENMKDKMQMRETIAFQRHATWMEKAKRDEERATRLTLEREAAAAQREEDAKKKAKEGTVKIKRDVKKQAEERKEARKIFQVIKEKEKVQAKEETASLRRIREQERAEKLRKQRECEEILREQIKEQKSKQNVLISDVERKLNSKYLPKDVRTPDQVLTLPYIR